MDTRASRVYSSLLRIPPSQIDFDTVDSIIGYFKMRQPVGHNVRSTFYMLGD